LRPDANHLTALVIAWLALTAGDVSAQVARVSGIVRDVSGPPIRGALVTADFGAGTVAATTDDNGRFTILGLRPGRWKLEVEAPGYLPESGELSVRAIGSPNAPIMIALRKSGYGYTGPLGNLAAADLQAQLAAAESLFDGQRWDDAVQAYRAILVKAPSLAVVHLQIAAAHRHRKDYDAAIAAYQDLLKVEPRNERAQVGIGMTNLERGDAQAAEQVLVKAASDPPVGREVYYSLAELQMTQGRASDAVQWYQKAAGADPSWGKPLYRLGELAMSSGDHGNAAKYLAEVIEVDPASPEAEQAKTALERLKK
jgi:tetratricopeptide (TPR) repeat protein